MIALRATSHCRIGLKFASRSVATAGIDPLNGVNQGTSYNKTSVNRNYFYHIDTKGQLFLADCKHKNFTSCMRDPKFLTFFYKQLRVNNTDIKPVPPIENKGENESMDQYKFISPCGKEINFVAHEDPHSALGFIGLEETGDKAELVYPGNTAKELLDPKELTFSSETGRLYHTITALPRLKGCQGLLHPSLCQIFSDLITHDVDSDRYFFDWQGQRHELKSIGKCT